MIYRTTANRNMGGGMGNTNVPALVSGGGQIAAGVVPAALAASGAIAAGSLAIPVIGAAIAGVTLAVTAFLNRNSEYFAQESQTTHIVDQAEVLMKQNLLAWQNADHTTVNQQQALENFNQVWNGVVQACTQSQFGDPGRRCVSDRSRGGQTDWFSYYYDPIANAPTIDSQSFSGSVAAGGVDLVNSVSGAVSEVGQVFGSGFDWSKLLIPAALIGLILLVD